MVSCVFFLCPAPVRNFHSRNVLLQSIIDDVTDLLSLLPPASTPLAVTTLLSRITAHTLLYINPVLGFRAFFWFLDP
jgi:hypothetical protein